MIPGSQTFLGIMSNPSELFMLHGECGDWELSEVVRKLDSRVEKAGNGEDYDGFFAR
jgi:hypothetical protein